MDYLIKKIYQICFVVCAVMIAALIIWILFNKIVLKNNVFDRKYSPAKKKAMHPAPPKNLLSKEPSELTIGTYHGKYVNLPFSNLHGIFFGEPGVGKSSTILNAIIGNFLIDDPAKRYYRSVLAVDSKPEIARKGVYEGDKDVRIINPTIPSGCGFDVMYGLNESSTDDELKARCRQISRSLIPDQHGDNEYFSGSAQNILTGALMWGFRKGFGFVDTVNRTKAVKATDLIAEIMSDPAMDDHPKIKAMVSMYEDNDSDEFASVQDTLGKDLDIFMNDSVIHCFSEKNPDRATPEDLINGTSIFLTIPDVLITDYARILGLIIEICIRYALSQDEAALKGKKPIYFLCDEATSIHIPSLPDSALPRGRSKGIIVDVIGQSYQGLINLYGKALAGVIQECCQIRVYFSCNDSDIARSLSLACGQYEEKRTSYTQQGISMISSSNTSQQFRNCMDVSDIMSLQDRNEVLVFYKGRWFVVNRCPYFKIPKYARRSEELFEKNLLYERRSEV